MAAELLLPSSADGVILKVISYTYMDKNINLTGIYRKLFPQYKKVTGLQDWQN